MRRELYAAICDVRARDIRIWQINFQNFRVRKICKTVFLELGAFSWQNAHFPGKMRPIPFNS